MWRRILLPTVYTLLAAAAISAAPAEGAFWRLGNPTQDPASSRPPAQDRNPAAALISGMTDEEIVAQVFMVGWPSREPTPELLEWIRRRNIGGIKVFGWNAEDLRLLAETIGTMQQEALATPHAIPLLTATDQEGGWVRHVKGATAVTPGNMAIGASGLPYDAYRSGYYIGRELRALGINMNFAPTIDVYRNPEAHVIGPRAFGSDPVEAGVLGGAYMRGLDDAGVIATAKHFPGHGNAVGDSHGVLPVLTEGEDELWEYDLVPYRMLIREDVPAVLSGHLSFPGITGSNVPASISARFKQDILRDRLGFEGIVITDDLYMGGATQYAADAGLSFAELCVEALAAGSDMILLSQTPDPDGEIWNAVLAEYRENATFRTRLRRSVERILTVKMRYLGPEDRVPLIPDPALVDERIPDPEGSAFFRNQAYRSATVVRNRSLPLELDRGAGVLLVGKDADFLSIGRSLYPAADVMRIRGGSFYDAPQTAEDRFVRLGARYDHVIFCLSDPATLSVLRGSEAFADRVSVVSILTPVYLQETPWVENAVAVYGWGRTSIEAAYEVLRGTVEAEGRLPIDME